MIKSPLSHPDNSSLQNRRKCFCEVDTIIHYSKSGGRLEKPTSSKILWLNDQHLELHSI